MRLSSSRTTTTTHRPQQDFPLWDLAGTRPSLDLQFANRRDLVDATTGQNLVTFTRASSGTYVGSDGLIKTATTNEARFDHNPTTGESLGLLVEESRTNLVLYSEDLTQWLNTNLPATANSTTSPDGTVTADKLIPNTNTTVHIRYVSIAVTSGVAYTTSMYAKADQYDQVGFLLGQGGYGVGGVPVEVKFNLTQGTYSIITSGTSTTASITSVGNGWYRCSVSSQATGTASPQHQIRVLDETGNGFFAGNSIKGLYVWGVQVEAGSFPTSYIPTTTSAVTRAADVASISGSNFSSWYRQDEGTVFNDCTSTHSATQILVNIAATANSTGTSAICLASNLASSQKRVRVRDSNSVDQASFALGASSSPSRTRIAAGIKADEFAASLDGSAALTDSSGTVPSVVLLEIGSSPSGVNLGAQTHRRLTYWPARLPNETLQTITQ